MEAKQLNIFDVLRQRGVNSETYTAITIDLKDTLKNIPSPDAAYIPPSFGEATLPPPPRTSSTIRIPNPPPKALSWLRRNWPWVLLGFIVVGVLIYLYLKRRKKKKEEEEFRRQEGERLPEINYPQPSEASGPVVELQRQTPLESYYEDLERKERLEKAVERLSKVESPKKNDPPKDPKQPDQPK